MTILLSRDAISRDSDPRHNIATMICNQFKGISNDHEAKLKLAELSAQLIPSDLEHKSMRESVAHAIPFAARPYIRSADRDQLAIRNNKEKSLDIMKWITPVATFSWMDQLKYWTDDHNPAQ